MTLARQLTTLEVSGLIRLAQTRPELEYIFRHTLVQEAAYESLLRQDRRRLHLAVGECLERLYPDRLDEFAPVLALHFYEAGEDERALKFSTIAADAAFVRSASSEAAQHYRRALEVAGRQGASSEQIIHLYSRYGRILEMSGAYDEALDVYDELEKTGREWNDASIELAALMLRGTVHSAPTAAYDLVKGRALSERAFALARQLGDRQAEAKVLWNLMLLNSQAGQFKEALQYGEQSLALARELNLREQLAYTLNDTWSNYMMAGEMERGQEALREARQLWRELGNLPMLADSLASSAVIHVFSGEFEQGITLAEEAQQITREIDNPWGQSYSRMMVGIVYLERGHVGQGIEVMEECIRLAELAGFAVPLVQTRSELALVYGAVGELGRAFELAGRALANTFELFPADRAWPLGALTRLHLLNNDLVEAEATFREMQIGTVEKGLLAFSAGVLGMTSGELAFAKRDYVHAVEAMDELVTALRQVGMRLMLPDALYLKGKAILRQDRIEEARRVLEEARAEAEALGSRRTLWEILAELGEVESKLGNSVKAKRFRAQAREIVQYIANHIGTPERRASFLNLPNVQTVLKQ